MPTFDLTRPARPTPDRRRAVSLVIGTLLAAGVLALTVVSDGDSTTENSQLGPTVAAETRDLAATLTASGTLQRSSESTVAYAGALGTDDGTALPEGSGGDDSDTGDGDTDPVSYLTGTSSTTSTTTSTTVPCSPTSTSSTSTTSSSTTSTTPCAPQPRPPRRPRRPPPPTTTTPPGTTPTTPPPSDGDGDQDDDNAAAPTGSPDGDPGSNGDDSAAPTGDDGDGGDEVPSAILTGLLDVGATADRGTVLYTADNQPVVALTGDLPAWRTLQQGVDDGADIQQLEENLAAMGYGDDLDIDETFTADTAAAVQAWETDLGRATPDGTVTIGDIVFLTTPGDVLGHEATIGDTLQAGSPVLTIGSEQRIIVAGIDATEAGSWTPGSTVELEWADGTTTQGTIYGTGRDVTDGQVELIVAVGTGDSGAGQRRSGAQATLTLVDARRDGVIAVPVAAIIDDGGSPAVRVAQPNHPDQLVPVETGLVADGWIEITAGLHGGEQIRLPG